MANERHHLRKGRHVISCAPEMLGHFRGLGYTEIEPEQEGHDPRTDPPRDHETDTDEPEPAPAEEPAAEAQEPEEPAADQED